MFNAHAIKGMFRGAVVAAGATFLASQASAETLKLAHWVPPQHTLTASTIEPLKNGVEADTNGALTIDVYPGGELGKGPLEQYIRAVQGVADIVWGLQGYTSSQFPKTMVSELPGVLPEGKAGYEILWDSYDAGQLANEFPGTVPLALWLSEPNIFIMKDREIPQAGRSEGSEDPCFRFGRPRLSWKRLAQRPCRCRPAKSTTRCRPA